MSDRYADAAAKCYLRVAGGRRTEDIPRHMLDELADILRSSFPPDDGAEGWIKKAIRVLKKVQAVGDSYNWKQADDARRFVLQDVNSALKDAPKEQP